MLSNVKTLSLDGTWDLTYAEGRHLIAPGQYTAQVVEGHEMMQAEVPGDVHTALMKAGVIEDPNIGLNSLKARWVEEQFWVYRRTFDAPRLAGQRVWLVFDRLEYDADFHLNGQHLGKHANALRPARLDVTDKIKPGKNLLVVKLSSGLHSASDKPAANWGVGEMGRLTKRHWLRRPQYQGGWDWSCRLGNVGILGSVRLEWCRDVRVDQLVVFATCAADLSKAAVRVRAHVDCPGEKGAAPLSGTLTARIAQTGAAVSLPVSIAPGEQKLELSLDIDNPELWWPLGHGAQHRYSVDVTLKVAGRTILSDTRSIGVRRVEMDQSPHPVTGRYCTLKINNRPIFCKGGNWVPADLLYGTVTPQRIEALITLAAKANFNMLRIWGGGLYVDHNFLDICDQMGMLVWHDFAFACAKFPGDDPEFSFEVQREVTWIVRELAHHPSLVVWCGNNEVEIFDTRPDFDKTFPTHPHYSIFHRDIPRIVTAELPSVLHWLSSPWSPDYKAPNDPTVGDQHPWRVSLGNPGGAEFWTYRTNVDRFANEGGVLGASSPATLRQFLPPGQQKLLSLSWDHHDNPFAAMAGPMGSLGRAYQTVRMWTGLDPLAMNLDDYSYISALLQAEGLREYILNYRRRMFSSACAIFWMYNDSWPVTHGWTIVDYYLRKKLAYHPVRRSFAPVTVVVAEEGSEVVVFGVNDSTQDYSCSLRWGLFTMNGQRPIDESRSVTIPANASTVLATMPKAAWEKLGLRRSGAFAVLLEDGVVVAQDRLLVEQFKDLALAKPAIRMKREGSRLTLSCETFAWGVCLDVDGEAALDDNCFDLLPGIPYTMNWPASLGRPRVVQTGNDFLASQRRRK